MRAAPQPRATLVTDDAPAPPPGTAAHASRAQCPLLTRSPDHGDSLFGDGDTVRVLFDQATDRAQGADAGDKTFVDALFSFSMPLGLEYMGEWLDDSTFAVTVLSTTTTPMSRNDFSLLGVTSTTFDALDTDDDESISVS